MGIFNTVKIRTGNRGYLICIYTIDALANAKHEIAVKNFDGLEKEFGRAASICRMPLTQLKDVMKGDYK